MNIENLRSPTGSARQRPECLVEIAVERLHGSWHVWLVTGAGLRVIRRTWLGWEPKLI